MPIRGTTQHTGFGSLVNTTRRKYQRFQVKIPILVNGVDKVGLAFRLAAETLNENIDGLGLLLAKEPSPFSSLLVSIFDKERLIQIQTEICHVTTLDTNQMLVGWPLRLSNFVPSARSSSLGSTNPVSWPYGR